ncbi:MAG: hypothetical protein ACRC8S_07705, partial [Fimbriiglobus sp.]
ENDRKPDGSWPGRDGAQRVAESLTRDLGRKVRWVMPPEDAKDVRDWLTARVAEGASWDDAGQAWLTHCEKPAKVDADPVDQSLPQIVIGVKEHEVNDQAIQALAVEPDLYQRGGLLTRVITEAEAPDRLLKRTMSARIEPIPSASLRERLTRVAEWVRVKATKDDAELVPAHPPEWCVNAIMARGEWSGIRKLEAVVEYPVVLPNGDLLKVPGFDHRSGLLYQPSPVPQLSVPSRPTQADATQAIERLFDVVINFPFVDDAHRASWLAGLLTPLARFAFVGNAPLFLVEGNMRGVGKGLLLNAISQILFDRTFAVSTYSHDAEEFRKRITAIARDGDLLVLFDNIAGPFGNATLDAVMTSMIWRDRLLGQSQQITNPLWTTWYGTGNNVALAGDMVRRICPIRLETPEERPEKRSDFRHSQLLQWVSGHRNELLSAALTILRGFILVGRPDQKLSTWGSFEGWSSLVRQAIVWAGGADPAAARSTLEQSDSETVLMTTLLAEWPKLDPEGQGISASQIIDRVYGTNRYSNTEIIRETLDELLPKPCSRALGYKLGNYRRTVRGEYFLAHATGHKGNGTKWVVRPASEFGISPSATTRNHSQKDVNKSNRLLLTPPGQPHGEIGEMVPPDPPRTPDGRPVRS